MRGELGRMKREVCIFILPNSPLILSFGVIAQLVERLLCKQDVGGSNPSGSIRSSSLRSNLADFEREINDFDALLSRSGCP